MVNSLGLIFGFYLFFKRPVWGKDSGVPGVTLTAHSARTKAPQTRSFKVVSHEPTRPLFNCIKGKSLFWISWSPNCHIREWTPQDLHHGVWRSAHIRNVQTQNNHKYELHSHIIMVVYDQDCHVGLVLSLAKCGLLVQHLDLENVCT